MNGNVTYYQVKLSWWFKYIYMPVLITICRMLYLEPNEGKVKYWLNKAIRISCER